MPKSKDIIQNRTYKAVYNPKGFSTFDYHIVASNKIIKAIDEALSNIEEKHPKSWDKEKSENVK